MTIPKLNVNSFTETVDINDGSVQLNELGRKYLNTMKKLNLLIEVWKNVKTLGTAHEVILKNMEELHRKLGPQFDRDSVNYTKITLLNMKGVEWLNSIHSICVMEHGAK